MRPPFFRIAWLASCLAVAPLHAEPPPAKGPAEDLESEAMRLLNDLPALTDPGDSPAEGPILSVQQAKTRLYQTQRKLLKWEKLLKDGVLSQSEVERCTVELADALARYEHANLADLQRQLTSAQERVAKGAPDQALVDAAAAAVQATEAAVAKADAQLFQTKYDLAKVNLERQKRLFAEKLISHAAVLEAESLVQRLEEQQAARK